MRAFNLTIKICLLSGMLVLLSLLFAEGGKAMPEKVDFIRKVGFKGADWYREQANLWKKEIEKNPQNKDAWFNYYLASEYSYWGNYEAQSEKKAGLEQILTEMQEAIPNSFEYHLFNYRLHHDLASLKKAYQLEPDNPLPYYDLIVHYEMEGNKDTFKELNQKLYRSQDIASGLLEYNYNVLMSVAPNAILFTNGDNDTYPCWVLQSVKNVRPGVTVLNRHLIRNSSYLKQKLAARDIDLNLDNLPSANSASFMAELCKTINTQSPEMPIYTAATVDEAVTDVFKDDLYLVGLAFRYNQTRFDNIARLKENWKNQFRLDYLKHDWYSEEHPSTSKITSKLNMNYIPPLMILYEQYAKEKKPERARQCK
ncbi:MAG: hypothetical protein GWN16_01565, partial [Calditrichae bacterium]|nr:hypothetical protein [Calditrichia bacterium]